MKTDTELDDDLFLIHPSAEADGPAKTTLSFSRTPTVLLTFAANRFTRSASRVYQKRFGIGAMDWRMLVMLAREPRSSVSHASKTIGIDKAAVSRSVQRLEKKGLIVASRQGNDERRKEWRLTEAGIKLHNEILAMALDRQKQLLKGFSANEVKDLTSLLRRFLNNIESLD